MLWVKYSPLIFFFFFPSFVECLFIDLYHTDSTWFENDRNYNGLRYDCLHLKYSGYRYYLHRHIMSYCLGESPSRWISHISHDQPHFTFRQLAQENITGQHLHIWSAPIDVIESYQHYLDQLSSTKIEPIDEGVFYNCTWPRFGSFCEYSFAYLSSSYSFSSLNELLEDFYSSHQYEPASMTCYEHLKCTGSPPGWCLDWTEICDGIIDCLNDGVDEEHCWQLEVHECAEDEYQCRDGQCIPKIFARESTKYPDCLDGSDEVTHLYSSINECPQLIPSPACEDVRCEMSSSSLFSPTLTSSCHKKRQDLILKALFSIKPDNVSNECWSSLQCMALFAEINVFQCAACFDQPSCGRQINIHCPDSLLFVPTVSILRRRVYNAYTKQFFESKDLSFSPEFTCFDNGICNMYSIDTVIVEPMNHTCYRTEQLFMAFNQSLDNFWMNKYFLSDYFFLRSCSSIMHTDVDLCGRYNMFRCKNTSKCISKRRLLDKVRDCAYGDDEQIDIVSQYIQLANSTQFFRCGPSDIYISYLLVNDDQCDCRLYSAIECADESLVWHDFETHLSFRTVCDGFAELLPVTVDGRIMTDETDCHHWLCSNVYTRCDRIWNCPDGRDEVDCDYLYPWNCSSNHRACVLPHTNEPTCISIDKVNDGHVDCLGGTDEIEVCRYAYKILRLDRFHCINDTNNSCIKLTDLCNGHNNCLQGDDEQFCRNIIPNFPGLSMCTAIPSFNRNVQETFFCERFTNYYKRSIISFSMMSQQEWFNPQQNEAKAFSPSLISDESRSTDYSLCHRGIPLRLWLHPNYTQSSPNQLTTACLCPPSFYGPLCQYQNQRILLTMQFRELSDSWQTLFAVIICLVQYDPSTHDTHIHSAQQLTNFPIRDCQMQHTAYLLYASRPFNTSFNYSIRIHIYDKMTFTHRSTWQFPVLFPFLPVYRLTLLLDIPSSKDKSACSKTKCGSHGQCIRYTQHRQSTKMDALWYCQCDRGWSGQYCTQTITSLCSSDSLHLDTLIDGRSICICPLDKLGDRCLIKNHICDDKHHSNLTCLNGGRCIPNEDGLMQQGDKSLTFICICPKEYTGNRCEMRQTQLILTFDSSSITLPDAFFLHFIRYWHVEPHQSATTIKHIPVNQVSVIVYWPQPFHLAFIELHDHQYYLVTMQKNLTAPNDIIKKTINSSNRCPHISELFNRTIFNYHSLLRIKYYHLLCQPRSSSFLSLLSCFFDNDHLCICDLFEGRERQANCFEFNHAMKLDCMGKNGCDNGARCIQDHPTCPQTSMCICPKCFYGRLCQFSMNGYSLTLDGILGYHIRSKVTLRHQSSLVHVSTILALIIFVTALINGICCFITFKKKKILEVGCGYYLLASSYTTLFTAMFFVLKFSILLASQMGHINHRSFLSIQCMIIDYGLRVCLSLDQWLSGCVALERTVTVLQRTNFNKAKSRRNAKHIIVALVLMVSMSIIHDPMHRRLIEDDNNEEHRIWCVASYPSRVRSVDAVMTLMHFGVPFVINILSALIIIWQTSRIRTNVRMKGKFRIVFKRQIVEHKHLLISPLLIIALSFPRLVITLVAGCMQAGHGAWLYSIGYMITLLPSSLTFFMFVMPSKTFRQEFYRSVFAYRRQLLGCIGCMHSCRRRM